VIDYVLEKTGEKKLFYVGHSQGTSVFFVMCSEKPEYNSKIRAKFGLASIAYLTNVSAPGFKIFAAPQSQLRVKEMPKHAILQIRKTTYIIHKVDEYLKYLRPIIYPRLN
jgi:pimeloyl-ACP methyl ester carboxylesterase